MDAHSNLADSTVATAPSPATSGTSVTLPSGDGAKFAPNMNCVVCPAAPTTPTRANAEIVRVTAVVGDVLTIVRTQEFTSARAILVGDQFYNAVTAKVLTDIEAAIGGATAVGSDPGSPADGTIWFRASGTSPTRKLEIRWQDGGTAHTIAFGEY